jgi:hypothetical protein
MSEKKRFIIDPGPQKIGQFDYTLQMYLAHYIRNHPALNNTGAGIRAALHVEISTETAAPYYAIRNDAWAILRDIDQEPGDCGYPRLVLSNAKTGEKVADEALPKRVHAVFMEAIADAGTKEPAAAEDETEATQQEAAE